MDLGSSHTIATRNNLDLQALQLDASLSVDEDDLDDELFEFGWSCVDAAGRGACLSGTGEALLDAASSVEEAALSIPAGSFPVGELTKNDAKSPGPLAEACFTDELRARVYLNRLPGCRAVAQSTIFLFSFSPPRRDYSECGGIRLRPRPR